METAYTILRRRVAAVMVLPPRATARRSEEQWSIGLQPVFHSHHRAMLYFSPQIVYKSQGFNQGFVSVLARFYGPKGQDSLAQALAWVFRFLARGP